MTELELKFEVPEDRVASLKSELKRHGACQVRMLARYYDTFDGERSIWWGECDRGGL